MMKCQIKNKSLFIYPILILIVLFIFSFLNIHGSSIGIYNQRIFNNNEETHILLGRYRAIRSDEYLVGTPMLISQELNNTPIINTDMGIGNNSGITDLPSNNIFSIFKPQSWIFFFSNNLEFSFSFHWWIKFSLLLISTYLLILELTKNNLFLATTGSLLFFFTPFIQWWLSTTVIYSIAFGIFFFLKITKNKNWIKQILYGLGLTYWVISFALILYPPFQIPLMYIAIFIGIGTLLERRKIVLSKDKIKRLLIIFSGIIILTIFFIFLFFNQFKEIIEITSNTVYPGARFISAGQGSIYQLFNGFYNLLMQKDSNGAPFANQSEASNFFILSIPLIIWVVYKNINQFVKNHTLDYIGLGITSSLIFLSIFYFVPLPDFLSKYTGMYMVPATRMYIGMGFSNYLLIFYLLTKDHYKVSKKKLFDWFLAISISFLTGVLIFKTGYTYYNLNPQSFEWPNIISPEIKILMVSVFVFLITGLLLFGYKKLFMSLLLLYGIVSTIYINPLYKGLDILVNTDLADYIEEISVKDDSKWVAYEDNMLAQYALANNASIINGIHQYPQFEMWDVLDPERKYIDTYNRYAHINISEYTEGEEYIRLLYPDALEINISPCNVKWDSLNVKYIITNQDLSYSCLKLLRDFPEYNIQIYQRCLIPIQPSS